MSELFVDTSGWANLIDISQPFHPLSAKIYQNARLQKHKIITTSYIITELVALLASPIRLPRPKAIAFIQSLKTSPYVEVIHVFYCDNLGVEDLIKQIRSLWVVTQILMTSISCSNHLKSNMTAVCLNLKPKPIAVWQG